ncbi:hypothetical protein ACOSQ2_021250 [Xanthoceras sorbifolium]
MSTAPNQTIETSNSRSPSNSPITDVSSFIRSFWSTTCINVLTGDNYPTWKRSMKMTLNPKTKLRFIEGSMFGNDATIWCCHGCSMKLRRVLQVV